MITLEQLLGGPYPSTEPRGPWPDILADLAAVASIRMANTSLPALRQFMASAQPSEWEPIIGSRYGFNVLSVCRTLAETILTERGLV